MKKVCNCQSLRRSVRGFARRQGDRSAAPQARLTTQILGPRRGGDSRSFEEKEIAAPQQECNSKGTAPKDWTLATARKFGTDSEGHGRHPILTDARGVTEPPRRVAQQLGVSRKLENRKLALAHWQGPAGQHYHAGAPHVARHAGTEGFKMALEAARNRPTVRGSGAFGQDVYVRVPIPQGRSTGGNSPTTTMESGWGLTSLRLEIGSDPLTGTAVRLRPPPAPPSDVSVDTEGPKDT